MAASQMMKTQIALNWICCSIDQSPYNFIYMMPTGNLQERISTRIQEVFDEVPNMIGKVAKKNSRDSKNTIKLKEFIGGKLYIETAGAAANLKEVSARRVAFDEIDEAEDNLMSQGDPVELLEGRQTMFERKRKSYYFSSPTIEGQSKIEALFKSGTQRYPLADCVHCGHAQTLEFDRLFMAADGHAVYPCQECGGLMRESDKPRMFARGAWTEGIGGDGETESFNASAMFLPYGRLGWTGLMKKYAEAKKPLECGDDSEMIVFYNTRLARCWSRQKEQTKYDELMARAEDYRLGTVPVGGLKLSASIDTQSDRLELKVVAWGEGLECWIVDYQIILQSPAEEATWDRADALLSTKYRHESGNEMSIAAAFVDSGGHATQEVYNFTYSRRRRHIYAIKGASKPNRPILPAKPSLVDMTRKGETVKKGAQLWHVGTDTAKDYLAARWKKTSGHGAVHFSTDLPEDYYKQLTAEYRTTGYKRGMKTSWWEKKQQDRNEALDLMVYNLAAAHYLGLHKYKPGHWKALREKLIPVQVEEVKPEPVPEVFPDDPPAEKPRIKARPRRRNFVKGW
jgi:phage terminase large subunit GpA-like protein